MVQNWDAHCTGIAVKQSSQGSRQKNSDISNKFGVYVKAYIIYRYQLHFR